jgi:pyruvate dehydrogenase E2 component (dihydrolipoamide acetyltransferase)
VSPGDMIASVETDKATREVECFDDGVNLKTFVPEATACPSARHVRRVANPASRSRCGAPLPPRLRRQTRTKAPRRSPEGGSTANDAPGSSEPACEKGGCREGVDLAAPLRTGPRGRIVRADGEAAAGLFRATTPRLRNPLPAAKRRRPRLPAPPPLVAGEAPRHKTEIKEQHARNDRAQLSRIQDTVPHFYLETGWTAPPLLPCGRS